MIEVLTAQAHKSGMVAKYSDIAVVLAIVAIIGLMIFPLPTSIIDILVALNINIGMILILMAIYIARPLDFSAFPAVLLISTLFRLGLSVATTRLILLNADAGKIIDTFGSTVAGGNMVVGLVVFLIITVVQFIVIAKGAERVAEVAARFSLDGMPGKQMSIDSDLRSGIITKEEAREKRKTLELESKLHGNLDGAMKFVKGDAIASLVIIAINLVGGLAIGMLMLGMDFGDAMSTYSILTIGDGLVAQIPALLSAIAAGLIVTRTASEDEDTHLGQAIADEIAARPRVLLAAGGLSIMASFVPGFPTMVFLVLAVILFFSGAFLMPALRERATQIAEPIRAKLQPERPKQIQAAPEPLSLPAPKGMPSKSSLTLHVAASSAIAATEVLGIFARATNSVSAYLGIPFPDASIEPVEDLPSGQAWQLSYYDVPIAGGPAETEAQLEADIVSTLKRQGHEFLGIQETSDLLNDLGESYPDLVKEALRAVSLSNLSEIFRRLLQEEVPIRNMRAILEGLVNAAQRERDVTTLTEYARIALKREINHRYAPEGQLRTLMLDSALENQLREMASETSNDSDFIPMDPALAKELIDELRSAAQVENVSVLLTTIDLRRQIRKLIEPDLPELTVLSFNELQPHLKLDVVHRIALASSQKARLTGAQS